MESLLSVELMGFTVRSPHTFQCIFVKIFYTHHIINETLHTGHDLTLESPRTFNTAKKSQSYSSDYVVSYFASSDIHYFISLQIRAYKRVKRERKANVKKDIQVLSPPLESIQVPLMSIIGIGMKYKGMKE